MGVKTDSGDRFVVDCVSREGGKEFLQLWVGIYDDGKWVEMPLRTIKASCRARPRLGPNRATGATGIPPARVAEEVPREW